MCIRAPHTRPQGIKLLSQSEALLLYVAGLGRNRPGWAGRMPTLCTTGNRERRRAITARGELETLGPLKCQWCPQLPPCPATSSGLVVKEPGIFSLVAPGEDVKFPSSPPRLATKARSPATLWRKLDRYEQTTWGHSKVHVCLGIWIPLTPPRLLG